MSPNLQDNPYDAEEIDLLIYAVLHDEASAEDVALLERLVIGDERARKAYVAYIYDSLTLYEWAGPVPSEETVLEQVAELAAIEPADKSPQSAVSQREGGDPQGKATLCESPSESSTPNATVLGFLQVGVRQVLDFRQHPLQFSVLALMMAAICWAAFRLAEERLAGVKSPTVSTIATLVQEVDAKWFDGVPSANVNEGPLQLAGGTARLRMNSGAVVDLLGPTELHLDSDMAARCVSGLLSLYVPESAQGFTLEADGFEIVDLGTRCNLAIEPDGSARVEVTEGSVEVRAKGKLVRVVEAGEVMSRVPGKSWRFLDARASFEQAEHLAVDLKHVDTRDAELPDFDAIEPIFSVDYEDGKVDGVKGVRAKPPAENSITVDSDVIRSGSHAILHQVRRGQYRAASDNVAMAGRSRYSEGEHVQYRFSVYRPEDSAPGRLGIWSFKRFAGPADQIITMDEDLKGFGITLLEDVPRDTWIDVILRVKWGYEKETGWVKAYAKLADEEAFTLRGISVGRNMRNARPRAAYCIWGATRPNFKRGRADAVWAVYHDDISAGFFEPTAEEAALAKQFLDKEAR